MTDETINEQIQKRKQEMQEAFGRMNASDDLQPSSELDHAIFKMAADEVASSVSSETEQTQATDITDISFRRGQREAHQALKKKGIFPGWLMPMGLAATVLLSFGVVNKVLLSPEFDNLTKQSSYEVSSDAFIVTDTPVVESSAKTLHDDKLVDVAEESPVSFKDEGSVNVDSADASARVQRRAPSRKEDRSAAALEYVESPTVPPAQIKRLKSAKPQASVVLESDNTVGADTGSAKKLENPKATVPASPEVVVAQKLKAEQERQLLERQKEQRAMFAKEKRERLTQAQRRYDPQPNSPAIEIQTETVAAIVKNEVSSIRDVPESTNEVVVTASKAETSQSEIGLAVTGLSSPSVVLEEVQAEPAPLPIAPVTELQTADDESVATNEISPVIGPASETLNEVGVSDSESERGDSVTGFSVAGTLSSDNVLGDTQATPVSELPTEDIESRVRNEIPVADSAPEPINEVTVTASKNETSQLEIDTSLADIAPSSNEIEEIVLTGSRASQNEDLLSGVLFEHKLCQDNYDCSLVALDCDTCACLDAVNLENYSKYSSEFTYVEIAEQCVDTTAECVRNYCQVQESE